MFKEIDVALKNGGKNVVGKPFVTLSYAQSIDGCISKKSSESFPLSSSESLILTHELRAVHDAILVGVNTIIADNPSLTVRLVEGRNPQPVVLDSYLRVTTNHKLVADNSLKPWFFTTVEADKVNWARLEKVGCRVFAVPTEKQGRVNLPETLRILHEHGINSLMVEGGSGVITSFYSQKLVDFVVITIAPIILNGFSSISGKDLEKHVQLRNLDSRKLGEDIIIWGELVG